MGGLILLMLVIAIALEYFIGGAIVWFAYDVILCALFPPLPTLSFWACGALSIAIAMIGSLFSSN